MNMNRPHRQKRLVAVLLATGLISASFAAHGEEREDLERLRATVLSLVDTLAKNGILSREKVDAMMHEAETMANARLAQLPAQMPVPELGADGKKIVRVPYVSEAVKVQMREQIKAEVAAQTKDMHTAAGALSDLGEPRSRFRVSGDLTLRGQLNRLAADNTSTAGIFSSTFGSATTPMTRAPNLLTLGGTANNVNTANTQEDSNLVRVRARVGVDVDLTNNVTASVAVTTGSTSTPGSDFQTLSGGNFSNKYAMVIDRASLKIDPAPWLSLIGGRFRNPFVGTDLLWSDYLNFEGVAMTLKPQLSASVGTFLTAGWFPLTLDVPNQSHGKSLLGIQTGVDWQFGKKDNHLKLAAGLYDYRNIEGVLQTQATYQSSPDYLASQYGPTGYPQQGNTLFRINAPTSIDSANNWGLASSFEELDVTGTVDVAQSGQMHVILTGDIVKNLGFDRADIQRRTGVMLTDGKSLGFLTKALVGNPLTRKRNDWNVSLGYRYLGSDAVLDAFTNADFGATAGLGCTNCKGTTLEMNYGLATNTWLSARWMSSNLIDSVVPTTSASTAQPTKFSTDVIQVDLNTKF